MEQKHTHKTLIISGFFLFGLIPSIFILLLPLSGSDCVACITSSGLVCHCCDCSLYLHARLPPHLQPAIHGLNDKVSALSCYLLIRLCVQASYTSANPLSTRMHWHQQQCDLTWAAEVSCSSLFFSLIMFWQQQR